MATKSARTVITILMDLLVVLAVLITVAVVVAFFGALTAQTWGEAIVKIADLVTLPLGVVAYKTPYGGVLNVDGALTVGLLLLAEWGLSVMRGRG